MTKRKAAQWVRTPTASELTLYQFPFVAVWVAAQPRGAWSWRMRVGNLGVAMGDARSRELAERAGVQKVKQMIKEIERACP
jgi:hypothetical protein